MKHLLLSAILVIAPGISWAFTSPDKTGKDTVIVKFGQKSKIVILVDDQEDLEQLLEYDLNSMLKDLNLSIDSAGDGSETLIITDESGEKYLNASGDSEDENDYGVPFNDDGYDDDDDDNDDDDDDYARRRYRRRFRSHHSINFDLGFNNYLENGSFPDENGSLYAIKPLGSTYVSINSIWRSHVTGRLFAEWGGNINWYNFKMQNRNARIFDSDSMVVFQENNPLLDANKSKLTVVYLNVSFVPVFHFGRYEYYSRGWNKRHGGVRIGVGGYAGYRLDSYTKFVFEESGDKEKIRKHDNFFLNNWRYGVRVQFGYRGFDIFANYDLNNLFSEGRGPDLNAISFGIVI